MNFRQRLYIIAAACILVLSGCSAPFGAEASSSSAPVNQENAVTDGQDGSGGSDAIPTVAKAGESCGVIKKRGWGRNDHEITVERGEVDCQHAQEVVTQYFDTPIDVHNMGNKAHMDIQEFHCSVRGIHEGNDILCATKDDTTRLVLDLPHAKLGGTKVNAHDYALSGNYSNPSGGGTTVTFALSGSSRNGCSIQTLRSDQVLGTVKCQVVKPEKAPSGKPLIYKITKKAEGEVQELPVEGSGQQPQATGLHEAKILQPGQEIHHAGISCLANSDSEIKCAAADGHGFTVSTQSFEKF